MAEVVPFPLGRRLDFVWRQARWFCEQPQRAAEKNLRVQIDVQAKTMRARGIAEDLIAEQCRQVEAAIRLEIHYQMLMAPDGVA